MARLIARVVMMMLAAWLPGSACFAQAPPPEDHKAHHPADPTPVPAPAPAGPSTKPTPAPAGGHGPDMGTQMMKEMERMMGASPRKPVLGRLLDVERLSEPERSSLRADAARESAEGLRLLREAAAEVEAARKKEDPGAIESAVARLREGATRWQTGHAVEEALTKPAPAAREAGLHWFKAQMNLEARPPALTGLPWGISWMHLIVMAALALFTAGGIGLYLYRVRRALGLLVQLTRREAPK